MIHGYLCGFIPACPLELMIIDFLPVLSSCKSAAPLGAYCRQYHPSAPIACLSYGLSARSIVALDLFFSSLNR
jgi:hypothetical protein